MRAVIVFCSGQEFHELYALEEEHAGGEKRPGDATLRFCQGDAGDAEDDPRDRPEEDCVDFDLADIARALEPLAVEVLGLRVEVEQLREELANLKKGETV